MRQLTSALLALLLNVPCAGASFTTRAAALALAARGGQESPRVLPPPGVRRRRRVRREGRRGRHGIRSAFKRAGKSAGRGGKRFGQNVARGRIVRGGKELGKGMGGFGKHTGKGIGRTMRRVFKP